MSELGIHPVAEAMGDLKARMIRVEHDQVDMARDLKAIRSSLDQARGGWKTLMLVGGLAGAVGAVVAKVIPFLGGVTR